MLRRLVLLGRRPALGEGEQGDEQEHRYGHEQGFVPTALVGEHGGRGGGGHGASVGRRAAGGTSSGASVFTGGVKDRIRQTIDVIRPALQADGGDIIVREVNEETGEITVELVGACGTCPASTQTMKAGIERILKDRVEGVTSVIAV